MKNAKSARLAIIAQIIEGTQEEATQEDRDQWSADRRDLPCASEPAPGAVLDLSAFVLGAL